MFRPQIKAYINSRFGTHSYAGEPYARTPEARNLLSEVEEMEAELHVALFQEDYQEAARLRDRIRSLRNKLRSEI